MGSYADLLDAQNATPRDGEAARGSPSPPTPKPSTERPSSPQDSSPASQDVGQPAQRSETARTAPTLRAETRPAAPPPARPPERTPGRQITRYAFEFYQDQIERLRRTSLEDKMQGGKRSMSEMVREAVDRYFAEVDREEDEGEPDDRASGRAAVRPSGN